MNKRSYLICLIAIVLGVLIVAQIRSFSGVNELVTRNSQSNIFDELRIISEKNSGLRKEIEELQNSLKKLDDQSFSLDVIEAEISKYRLLNGEVPVFGEGITVTINWPITSVWIGDLVNEFYNAGAHAVSLNGIRITNRTLGFDPLPNGQTWFSGQILSTPYVFNVIGDKNSILTILELPGGIFDRLKGTFQDISIIAEKKDVIKMSASTIKEQ